MRHTTPTCCMHGSQASEHVATRSHRGYIMYHSNIIFTILFDIGVDGARPRAFHKHVYYIITRDRSLITGRGEGGGGASRREEGGK